MKNTATNKWQAWEDKARSMTIEQLVWSMNDCIKAAFAMDEIDRTDGQDRAGRYRDECSVYRMELGRRKCGL